MRRRCCCVPVADGWWKPYTTGCNGAALSGVLCEAFTDFARTSLVASGITDAAGRVDIALPTGFYYVKFSHSSGRLKPVTNKSAYASASALVEPYTVNVAETGYACTQCDPLPFKTTLYATCSWGSATLTYSGGSWVGALSYAWGGSTYCSPATIDMAIRFTGSLCSASFTFGCETSFPNCPGSPGAADVTADSFNITSHSYVPSMAISWSRSYTIGPTLPAYQELALKEFYGGPTASFWMDITE